MSQGGFIVIEGIDGCGSTTQVQRLGAALRTRGVPTHTTCEPTSGPVGTLIRQALRGELRREGGPAATLDWVSLALLFAADRADHDAAVLTPLLADGAVVVSDRYLLSSLAYQSASSPDPGGVLPWIRTLNGRVRRPDLTIVLDVPARVAAARRATRAAPAELFEVDDLQHRLAELYARAEELVPQDRLVHLDGTASAEVVTRRILEALDAWWAERGARLEE